MHLFIFGLGYSSQAIAKEAMARGFKVSGTTRDEAKAGLLTTQGIGVFCHSRAGGNPVLPSDVTHILSSVPPQENGDIVLPVIKELDSRLRGNDEIYSGYLSTTGVYGDWDGAWVDEDSELKGQGERLQRRIAAEKAWMARGGHVFRLAGIYGPGRSAIDDVRDGSARRIDKKGQVFSRIHVEDIVQTVVASMLRPHPGSAYNVCDDLPAPAHEVVAYAAELLGVSPPPLVPFAQAQLSAMGQEFYASNRRVKNAKIKDELGVSLRYPTYREGLAQCLQLLPVE